MSTGVVRKTGKKTRKYGRNKVWCAGYTLRGQRRKNKLVKVRKHLARFPSDKAAQAAVDRLRQ